MLYRDYFSVDAGAYASFRPKYPPALFDFLTSCAPARDVAWDCATGNGQAAIGLAPYFARVIATDASESQISQVIPHRGVEYRTALAERSGLESATVDLITVAQALHWLNREAFYEEAKRVLVARGVLAVWCYGLLYVTPEIDSLIRSFYFNTLGPFWPPGRELVDTGYSTIDFPFEEISAPPFSIEKELTLEELAGYLRTWSATRRFVKANGHDPVSEIIRVVSEHWGRPGTRRTARWPLHVRAGRSV